MKSIKIVLSSVLLTLSLGLTAGHHGKEVKIYWGTSGFFGPFNIQGLIPTYPEAKDITIPVSMFVISHPNGLVVYDTGNNVAIENGNCKNYWAPGLCDFLKPSQDSSSNVKAMLNNAGFSVDDVKVVVSSHAHLDHAGNIEMFPNAIHVFQKVELYQGWFPEKFQGRDGKGPFVLEDLDNARGFNFLELEGDYDLFGDGTVKIISTPGHTLGHQSMKVKLSKGGSVLLAQDAIWMKENLEGHAAGLNFSVQEYHKSVNKLKFMRDLENIPLYMGHDADQFATGGNKWHY